MRRSSAQLVNVPVAGTALFLIDVINDLDFQGSDDAMRELKIFAPSDCIVSNTADENAHALRQIRSVLKGNLTRSDLMRFRTARRRRASRSG